jgi:hypothetical protein
MNLTLKQLTVIEQFLDSIAARGESLADARENVSCQIFLCGLHQLHPDRDQEFYVAAAVKFLMEARK